MPESLTMFSDFFSQQSLKVGTTIMSFFQKSKLRHRKVKTAGDLPSRNSCTSRWALLTAAL